MVSKSYSVSKCSNKNIFDFENKETCDDINFNNMQNNEDHEKKNYSKKDLGFVINVNEVKREMVNNKPSKNIIFHDDNFSSSSPSSSSMSWLWWSSNMKNENKNISMLKWNKEYIQETVNYTNIGMLMKIIAACISIALIGFIVSSLLMTGPQDGEKNAADAVKRQRLPLNNDSIIDTSTATSVSTQNQSTEVTAASLQTIINNSNNLITDFNDNHLYSSVLPPNTINDAIQNVGHVKKSNNDEISLTKNYVERINFYTTSNKNLFSVKVLPTLPSIKVRNNIKSTSELPLQNYANDCQSTNLPLCQGILMYDLSDSKLKWNLTNLEYEHFQHLIFSNCSNRVHEYVCHLLEPECRPSKMKNLMPCRRICKGIFESCSHIIASSEVLTQFFDCNQYIDSNDALVCEDITRSRKKCFDDEFQCGDLSCISLKWRCDNIRDCTNGEDEEECKFCNYDEFKCLSDQKCINQKWHCDGSVDCSDGSDETNCENDEIDEVYDDVYNDEEESIRDEEKNAQIFYDDNKDYNDRSSIDHNDSDGDKIISTGDDVVPIFINPNSTLISDDLQIANSSAKLSKRFRSTMRKTLETTTNTTPKVNFEETSTSVTKTVTSSHSTSHTSPCPEDHLRCVDGLCITLDQICDKIQDCSDNSDELHCEY